MNKKIRRILGLISFIALFTLTNCQTEDLIIKDSYNSNKNAKVKNLTFKQFQNQKYAQKTLIELNRFKKNNIKSINSKNLSAKETIINIDSTYINQIIENGITSYTFSIINDNHDINQFENLVIQTDSLEQTSVFLINYIPESHYDINNPFVGTREITQLDSNVIINANNKTIVCLTVTTYINYYLCDEGVIESPETCDFQYTQTFTDTTCETLSGGGGDTYTNTTFVINNLSTTTGGGSGGNTIITSPIPVNYKKLRQLNFSNTLTLTQKNWLNNPNNIASQIAIYDYLETTLIDENGFELLNESEYSIEAKNFVKELINNCLTNSLTEQQSKNYINSNIIVNKIIDTNLDACGKSVLTKLKNLNQNDISLILRRFGNVNSTFNLTFTTDYPEDPNALASTNWVLDSNSNTIPYNYIIKIRTEETQISTELAIAGSLLHEIIHAYFLSLIDDCVQANNCTTLQTFPELWNFYVANQTGSPTNSISQHNQIAMSYVNIMGAALQEYVTGVTVQPGMQTQVYTDVAWYGLQGTTPYNALPQIDKDRINFRFENVELLNQQSTNPSGIVVSPVGTRNTPC